MNEWYVIGRDGNGEQLAYIVAGDTTEEVKQNFTRDYPDLTFVNMF